MLEGLTGDVEGKILRVDDTLDEVEVLGNEVLAVVHNEDAADVKLDVVALLLCLEEIEGSPCCYKYIREDSGAQQEGNTPFGDEENGLELELTLDGEVLDGKVFFPVVCQALVECAVFVVGDILGVPRPDGFGLVEFLVFDFDLLNLFLLLWLVLVLVLDLLDLGLFFVFLDFFLIVFDLLNNG